MVFDDLAWQSVRTPHDWAIEQPFERKLDGGTGKLPWRGVGWYRKWLMIEAREEGSRVYLDFDGVMAGPQVYVNGELAGEWDYGYTPFRVDLTPHIRFGRANIVAVRVDTTKMRSRWYPGAGIYRKVKCVVSPPVHLAQHGTYVTTPSLNATGASVSVSNEIDSKLPVLQEVELKVELREPNGEIVSEQKHTTGVEPNATETVSLAFDITNPKLWDIDSPRLYEAITELSVNGAVVERRVTRFGLRNFEFTADDGFHLNGRRVELHGVNLHHDLGPLGAAFNLRAAERQLDIMQEMGINALRTSHNPPAAELLDLCDERGILVWDELFDKWDDTAARVDGEPPFEEHFARHAKNLLRRDRNHPSVVVWSIGNEIGNQPWDKEGKTRQRVQFAKQEFLRHDDTRPVAIACHIPETGDTDILTDIDVAGWNYQRRYGIFHENFPDTPIIYSESASALSTRGRYVLPRPSIKCEYLDDGTVNAYEFTSAPWSDLADVELELMKRDRFVAGEFVWTGFDYLGEPTPFDHRARSSYFGIVDLVGLPKDRYYLYRSAWRPNTPTVHIAPHWNWQERVGEPTPVQVYTNGDSAELFLNGESLGVRRKGDAPASPLDVATEGMAEASSQSPGMDPNLALGVATTDSQGWRAVEGDTAPRYQIDLKTVRALRAVALTFPSESKFYAYRLEGSVDGHSWEPIAEKKTSMRPRWGGVKESIHAFECDARYVRFVFGECRDDKVPALTGVSLYEEPYESEYYRPTYDYRLRWDDVIYEPGELEAVAYLEGDEIGRARVRTAGEPTQVLLTADKTTLKGDGEDLVFLTVEAADASGNLCPLAMNTLRIECIGACEIAGHGNGNPLSMAPLRGEALSLFYGKAVIIVRSRENQTGPSIVRVISQGLQSAETSIDVVR